MRATRERELLKKHSKAPAKPFSIVPLEDFLILPFAHFLFLLPDKKEMHRRESENGKMHSSLFHPGLLENDRSFVKSAF